MSKAQVSQLFEMGWNDVLGNLKRATAASEQDKRKFCQNLIDGKIPIANNDGDYIDGLLQISYDPIWAFEFHLLTVQECLSSLFGNC